MRRMFVVCMIFGLGLIYCLLRKWMSLQEIHKRYFHTELFGRNILNAVIVRTWRSLIKSVCIEMWNDCGTLPITPS